LSRDAWEESPCKERVTRFIDGRPGLREDGARTQAGHETACPECIGAVALSLPKCWDQMKPIPIVEGRGRWDAPLPPPFRLGEFETERLMFRLEVHDLDAPNAEAVWKKTVEISIRDDTGSE